MAHFEVNSGRRERHSLKRTHWPTDGIRFINLSLAMIGDYNDQSRASPSRSEPSRPPFGSTQWPATIITISAPPRDSNDDNSESQKISSRRKRTRQMPFVMSLAHRLRACCSCCCCFVASLSSAPKQRTDRYKACATLFLCDLSIHWPTGLDWTRSRLPLARDAMQRSANMPDRYVSREASGRVISSAKYVLHDRCHVLRMARPPLRRPLFRPTSQ